MDSSNAESDHTKEFPLGLDESTEEEYATQSKLLREFTTIANIDKAWTFPSGKGIIISGLGICYFPSLFFDFCRVNR